MWYKRNNPLMDMLLLEKNKLLDGKSISASCWTTSCHPAIYYFSITACDAAFYPLQNMKLRK